MAQFVDGRKLLPEATLDRFTYEIAREIGIPEPAVTGYGGDIPSRYWGHVGGRIGGNMVKVLLRQAEQALTDGTF